MHEMEHLVDATLGGGHATGIHAGDDVHHVFRQRGLELADDLAAAHDADGGLTGDQAEHVEIDVFLILDLDDVLRAVQVAVGVHDERQPRLGRVDFQVFENLQRGSGRHMVDNDAVLNAGDFHQA